MQLFVYRGPKRSGKTTQLHKTAQRCGLDLFQVIHGEAYTAADLELLIRCRIARGNGVICIDDCTEQQIERLEGLKGDLPADLTIHAVVAN